LPIECTFWKVCVEFELLGSNFKDKLPFWSCFKQQIELGVTKTFKRHVGDKFLHPNYDTCVKGIIDGFLPSWLLQIPHIHNN